MFFFWVWLLGPVGALLSMPITVLIVLSLQHNDRTRWMAALLTRDEGDSVTGPSERARSTDPRFHDAGRAGC